MIFSADGKAPTRYEGKVRRASSGFTISAALAVVLGSSPSLADEPPYVELAYEATGDRTCPSERYFRDLLTSRMGYEPFRPRSQSRVEVRLEPSKASKNALGASVVLRDRGDAREARRELVGQEGHCLELAQAVAVALAIMLDPFGEQAAKHVKTTEEPRPTPPTPPTPDVSPAETGAGSPPLVGGEKLDRVGDGPKEHPGPAHFEATLAGLGSLGLLPGPGVGGAASLAVRLGSLSLGAGARFETTPGAVAIDRDRVQASFFGGVAEGCLSRSILRGCLLVDLGSYSGREETVSTPRRRSALFADVGLRAAGRIPLGTRVALIVFVDARASLTPHELVVDGRTIFRPSAVTGAIGAGPSFDVF